MRNSIVTLFVAAIFAIATFINPAAQAMPLEEYKALTGDQLPIKQLIKEKFCGGRECTQAEINPVTLSNIKGLAVNVDFNDPAPASAPATTPPTAPASLTDHGASDQDGDGVLDEGDNCFSVKNFGQLDRDHDGSGDLCDNCPDTSNADQLDRDRDGWGDRCDNCPDLNTSENSLDCNAKHVAKLPNAPPGSDPDGDGISEGDDCPQAAEDEDGFQDDDGCADPDNDGDGVLDVNDHCPMKIGDAPNNGCPPASEQLLAAAPSPSPPAPPTEAPRASTALAEEGRTFWFVSADNEEVPEEDRLAAMATKAVGICPNGNVGVMGIASGGTEDDKRNPKFALNRENAGVKAVEDAGGHAFRVAMTLQGLEGKRGRGVYLFCTSSSGFGSEGGQFNAGSGRPEETLPTKLCWDRNGDKQGNRVVDANGVPLAGNEDNNLDGAVDDKDCFEPCWDQDHNGGFDIRKDAQGLPMTTSDGKVDEDWNQSGKFEGDAECKAPCWDKNGDHLFNPSEDINHSSKIEPTLEGDCPAPPPPGTGPSGFHFGVGAFGIPSFYDGESAIGGLYLSLGWRIAALNGPMARLYGGVGGSDYSYGGMAGLTVAWDVTDWLDIGPGLGANASWLNDLSLTPEYHFGLIGQLGLHYGRARLAFEPGFGIEAEKYEGNSYRRFRGAVLGGLEF